MLRRVPGTRFSEICLAALPFMGCALLLTLLIAIFPDLAVWLPWLGGRGGISPQLFSCYARAPLGIFVSVLFGN